MHLTLSDFLVMVSVWFGNILIPGLPAPGSEGRSSSEPNSVVLGPVTDLNIVNKVIAPDGFPRS